MAIRTAVLDDEPLAVEILADYVQKTEGLLLTHAGSDAFAVLQMVQKKELDLVLLDIQMPELTGIQFLKIIGDSCKVIVTTAYTEYALDGYELDITDYLLKPISYERFLKAIEKVKNSSGKNSLPISAVTDGSNYIFVKSEYKLVRIDLNDILYIESLRDYIAIHTIGQGKIMSLDSLRNMEEKLPADNFIRVHKSFIVAINKINFIERSRIIIQQQYIPIGDSFQENFSKKIKTG